MVRKVVIVNVVFFINLFRYYLNLLLFILLLLFLLYKLILINEKLSAFQFTEILFRKFSSVELM